MAKVKGLWIVCVLLLLGGCAASPYLETEVRYAFPFSTDYWQHSDRSWQCEQPQFGFDIGLEWDGGWSAGLYHESMLLCGSWNHKPEIYENGITLKKKWGGK